MAWTPTRRSSAPAATSRPEHRRQQGNRKYVGGGAIIGSIIGAVAGGAKGAAVGAAAGAAAGAVRQIATHGGTIDVPAEALLSYRLTRPLNLDVRDTGFDREGVHYHPCPAAKVAR
jgi:hypothetical protein